MSTEYEPICDESGEVCLTLAEYMQDEIFKLNTAEVLGTKNQLGGSFKRMDAYEYHCRLGHRGHFPGCHICQAVARSLKRTYVDRVLYQEVRNLYRFTMDAMVLSNRSFDGKKYAYMFIEPVLCFAKSRTEMSILREFIDIWHPEEHLKSEFFQSV